jgi:hypothetical protein
MKCRHITANLIEFAPHIANPIIHVISVGDCAILDVRQHVEDCGVADEHKHNSKQSKSVQFCGVSTPHSPREPNEKSSRQNSENLKQ